MLEDWEAFMLRKCAWEVDELVCIKDNGITDWDYYGLVPYLYVQYSATHLSLAQMIQPAFPHFL